MRQVGRSVQCRQNRRGRTAATWPFCLYAMENTRRGSRPLLSEPTETFSPRGSEEWRAVLGTADSGPKSMFDRLAAAVNGAVAPGKEPVTREFMDQFIEDIKNEPIARRIVEIRDSLCKLILEVIAELEPLIQTPYLVRGTSQ